MSPYAPAPGTAGRNGLVAILVAPLVLATAYLIALRLPATSGLARQERQLADLRSQAPVPAALDLQARELQQLSDRVESLRASAQRAKGGVVLPTRSALERAQLRQRLSALFVEHSLELLSEDRGELDLGPELASAISLASDGSGPVARVPVWTLVLRGDYLDMLAALRALSAPDYDVLPLRVEMRARRAEDGSRLWKLLIA